VARLFGDENFPLPVIVELRHLGHDAVTLQEVGHGNRALPDEMVLTLATRDRRAVLTIDRRDFIRLHGLDAEHSGIIVCSFDPDFFALAARIDAEMAGRESIAGQLLRVNRPGATD
jgi:Domain of unknown function (DUF5615)